MGYERALHVMGQLVYALCSSWAASISMLSDAPKPAGRVLLSQCTLSVTTETCQAQAAELAPVVRLAGAGPCPDCAKADYVADRAVPSAGGRASARGAAGGRRGGGR